MVAKTQKISQTVEIGDDRNQFTTTAASFQFFDPTGTLLRERLRDSHWPAFRVMGGRA
jgi:hypothetical protein